MTGETVLSVIRQTRPPPSVAIAVVVRYVCGHAKRVTLPSHEVPSSLLRCECGGRWRWIGEDSE